MSKIWSQVLLVLAFFAPFPTTLKKPFTQKWKSCLHLLTLQGNSLIFFSYTWWPRAVWIKAFFQINFSMFIRTMKFHRFWISRGTVNDDRNKVFRWTASLNQFITMNVVKCNAQYGCCINLKVPLPTGGFNISSPNLLERGLNLEKTLNNYFTEC